MRDTCRRVWRYARTKCEALREWCKCKFPWSATEDAPPRRSDYTAVSRVDDDDDDETPTLYEHPGYGGDGAAPPFEHTMCIPLLSLSSLSLSLDPRAAVEEGDDEKEDDDKSLNLN